MDILSSLTKILSILPGVGPRSARRISVVLAKEKDITKKLISTLSSVNEKIKPCSKCNNLTQGKLCNICNDSSRDHNQICIVSDITNLWAIEKTEQYEGVFHILDESSLLEKSNYIEEQIKRHINDEPQEFIIAMNPTIEGQATVHYIQSILKNHSNITLTTLALGIPMGSEIDYLDTGTVTIALNARKEIT